MDSFEGIQSARQGVPSSCESDGDPAPTPGHATIREIRPGDDATVGGQPTHPGPVDPAPAAEDACWEAASSLPPARPAPKAQSRDGSGVRADELIRLLVAAIVLLCFERRGKSFTVRELWDRVPDPKPQYKRLNSVGDVVGQGGGRHGLKLWKGAGGPLGCRENAVIALRRMAPDAVRGLAHRLGFDGPDAFWAAVNALPAAERCADV